MVTQSLRLSRLSQKDTRFRGVHALTREGLQDAIGRKNEIMRLVGKGFGLSY